MFTFHKSDTGAVAPWEYHEAVAGEYQVGMLLETRNGLISTGLTEGGELYLCMANKTVTEEDPILPVVHLDKSMILKTEVLNAMEDGLACGQVVKADEEGTGVSIDGTGTAEFVVVSDGGVGQGDTVYVRLK